MNKKWRGTALFATILVTMGLTIGLKLYSGAGVRNAAAATSSSQSSTAVSSASPSASPSASSSASASSSPSASSPAATGTATITGAVEQTPYGPIQVSVTFSDTKITSVTELQAPNDRDRSVEINAQAEPILKQEVLASQSAHVDSVSGATYTSQGYTASVQSAIDKR